MAGPDLKLVEAHIACLWTPAPRKSQPPSRQWVSRTFSIPVLRILMVYSQSI